MEEKTVTVEIYGFKNIDEIMDFVYELAMEIEPCTSFQYVDEYHCKELRVRAE